MKRETAPARCGTASGCITCSDEAMPLRVIAVDPAEHIAVCEDEVGYRSEVLTDLVDPVARGDILLVHAGAALARMHGSTPAGDVEPAALTTGDLPAGGARRLLIEKPELADRTGTRRGGYLDDPGSGRFVEGRAPRGGQWS